MKLGRWVWITLFLGACATVEPRPVRLTASEVPLEIARWEAETRRKGHEAEAHRNLWLLYSHPSLASPDYRRSLEELEAYLAAAPGSGDEPEVKRWLTALRTLREAQRAVERQVQENAALKGENRDLQRNLAEARRETREAREAIEKLKELDLQQDRLRKTR